MSRLLQPGNASSSRFGSSTPYFHWQAVGGTVAFGMFEEPRLSNFSEILLMQQRSCAYHNRVVWIESSP